MEIISRDTYIDHIMRYIGKGMMIALTGQRRVGKSYILRQIAKELNKNEPGANIIYINKEKKKFADIRTDDDLSVYLEDKIKEDKNNYLLIDEVQDIAGFEKTLRSLNADEECQIIITGSNAKMLSSEKNGKTVYFQVAYILTDEKTREREFGNLSAIKDNYPKYVVTMDPISKPKDYDGITHISLRQMLLSDSL